MQYLNRITKYGMAWWECVKFKDSFCLEHAFLNSTKQKCVIE